MHNTNDLSRLAGMTGYGKRHLRSLGLHDVSDLTPLLWHAPGEDPAAPE